MAKKIKGFYKLFLSFLMALVGFSACSKHEKEMAHAYGTPYEMLKLSGNIVDKNNNPVPGVRVKVKNVLPVGYNYNPYVISMPISDEKGLINHDIHSTFGDSVQIVFNKLDNTEYAQKFKDDSIKVKKVVINNKQSGWKTGEAKATFTLKLKDN